MILWTVWGCELVGIRGDSGFRYDRDLDGRECREEGSKVKNRVFARLGRIQIFSRIDCRMKAQCRDSVPLIHFPIRTVFILLHVHLI